MTLVASIQHTGTWFVVDFLKVFHDRLFFLMDLCELTDRVPTTRDLAQVHQGGKTRDSDKMRDRFLRLLTMVGHPIVIPLRDPMLSLLSEKRRFPDSNPVYLAEQWVALSRCWQVVGNQAMFFPIDLPLTKNRHVCKKKLESLLDFCGVSPEMQDLYSTHINKFARWDRHNATVIEDEYDPRKACSLVPEAVGCLLGNRGSISPMLRAAGYPVLPWERL